MYRPIAIDYMCFQTCHELKSNQRKKGVYRSTPIGVYLLCNTCMHVFILRMCCRYSCARIIYVSPVRHDKFLPYSKNIQYV